MRKLKLNAEQLVVETFPTADTSPWKGTILGAQDKEVEVEPIYTETNCTCGLTQGQVQCNTWERTCPACTGMGCD